MQYFAEEYLAKSPLTSQRDVLLGDNYAHSHYRFLEDLKPILRKKAIEKYGEVNSDYEKFISSRFPSDEQRVANCKKLLDITNI